MKAEIAKKWVKALRSGKYKQGRGLLAVVDPTSKEVTGYCCLGVLCELAVKAGVIKPGTLRESMFAWSPESKITYGKEEEAYGLPEEVIKWAGIGSHQMLPFNQRGERVENGCISLANLNDGVKGYSLKKHSFDEIADVIEATAAEL